MIRGIGVDIIDNRRIARILEKWSDRFLDKVFTKEELKFFELNGRKIELVASRWALKEAIVKATGVKDRKRIEILGKGENLSLRLDGLEGNLLYSISHERNYSVAFVVWVCRFPSPGSYASPGMKKP